MIVWHYNFWTGWTWSCDVCRTICGGALVSVRKSANEHVCPEWARKNNDIGIDNQA